MKRIGVRLTVIGLMATIAGAALIMGVYRLSWRWADDWAFDLRAAVEHRHQAEKHYPEVQRIFRDYRAAHPDDVGGISVVDGLGYRPGPELDRYIQARIAYHRRQAERHEWAVGRRWAYVTAEAPPPTPPPVPKEEMARAFGLKSR